MIENGLVSNDTVVVRLPQKWEHLAADRLVYITHLPQGDCLVFRTRRGKGGDFEGYLYTRAPRLKEGDKLEVVSRLPTEFGKIEVRVRSVLDTNWYSIGTEYLN